MLLTGKNAAARARPSRAVLTAGGDTRRHGMIEAAPAVWVGEQNQARGSGSVIEPSHVSPREDRVPRICAAASPRPARAHRRRQGAPSSFARQPRVAPPVIADRGRALPRFAGCPAVSSRASLPSVDPGHDQSQLSGELLAALSPGPHAQMLERYARFAEPARGVVPSPARAEDSRQFEPGPRGLEG